MNKFFIVILLPFCLQIFGQERGELKLTKNAYLFWEINKFDKSAHTYQYCKDAGNNYLCKIDDKTWYGADLGMEFPKNELKKLTLRLNNVYINLETKQMYNPNFSGKLYKHQFKIKKNMIIRKATCYKFWI